MAGVALAAAEIDRRLPVWVAMTDFFLDTEIQSDTISHIARTIDAAGFGAAEAEAILFYEVAPVFRQNLMAGAGEWAGWPHDYIKERVTRYLQRRTRCSAWRERWIWGWTRKLYIADWNAAKAQLSSYTRSGAA